MMERFTARVRAVRRDSPGTLLALETVLLGLILLFFLQLFSTVITSMFAQGLEHRSVPLAAFALTLFLAPVFTIMFYKRSLERRFSFVLAVIALLARGLTPHFAVIGRLILSATGTAALLLFFTSYFALKHTVRKWYSLTLDESYAVSAGVSLAIAVCLSIFFRTIGVTVDVSMDCFDWYPLIGWVLVVIAGGLLLVMWAAGAADPDQPEPSETHSAALLGQHPAVEGRSEFPPALFRHETHGGLALDPELIPWEEGASGSRYNSYHHESTEPSGPPSSSSAAAAPIDVDDLEPPLWAQVLLSAAWLTTVSMVLFAGLNSPTVLARWGNTHYPAVNSLAMASAAGFIAIAVFFPAMFRKVPSRAVLAADLLLIALLLVASLSNVAKNPHWNALQSAVIYPAILFSPVVYLHFSHLSSVLAFVDSSSKHRGLAFAVASFLLFFLVAAAIFTLTSSYVGVAVFRDLYWVVLFLVLVITVSGAVAASRYFKRYTESARSWYPAAIAVAGPVSAQDTASHPSHSTEHRPLLSKRVRWGLLGGVALLTVVVIVCSFVMVPDPPAAESPNGAIRIITYNILQGYTQHGTPNFRLLARDLDRLNLDVIAFQESDTARLSGANQDVVRFLAYHLNFHSYYGPKPTTGTYGLSFLSRFPIDWQTLWYLPSKNEQIACVEAKVRVAADKQLNLFVTHFGFRYEDDQVQQANYMLDLIGDRPNAVMVCDCNMHPLTAPYNITTSLLNDAWAVSTGSTDGGFTFEADNPYERIDYIFPSRDVKIRVASVLSGVKDSDHLPVFAELQINNRSASLQQAPPFDDVVFHQ